jgi:hypothetical protein
MPLQSQARAEIALIDCPRAKLERYHYLSVAANAMFNRRASVRNV